MPRRYLFGPVTVEYAEQNLEELRKSGDCLAFNQTGGLDLTIGPRDAWDAVTERLPRGWFPDCVVVFLPYSVVPACLWSVPIPVIGLAMDWNLLWHYYRNRLQACDVVFTDRAGVEAFAREGLGHLRFANLFGCGKRFLTDERAGADRDLDILFVGNPNRAIHRERQPFLARLARLSERYRVLITADVFGDEYRALLHRTRIAFNRGIRGECNLRVFEAAAAGALLFQEEGNLEVPGYFRDRRECVYWNPENLEELLEHYLAHEEERRAIADAGRAKVREYSFAALWKQHLRQLETEWPELEARARRRSSVKAPSSSLLHERALDSHSLAAGLLVRAGEVASALVGSDPALQQDLEIATNSLEEPAAIRASLSNALGVIQAATSDSWEPVALAQAVARHFQRAVEFDPTHVLAGLNLAESLVLCNRVTEASEVARHTLSILSRTEELAGSALEVGRVPPAFDSFRVEWERAGWLNPGHPAREAEAKRALLRWRLCSLLGSLTGNLAYRYEAVLARPDLPSSRAELGIALLQANHAEEAVVYLRQALSGDPFDGAAAKALHKAYGILGDSEAGRELAHNRRLLAKAAPRLVEPEDWFQESPVQQGAKPSSVPLTSIIVLCWNQLDCTRLCLESVLQHTHQPYELVVVDNGSTDGTPGYLDLVRSSPGPQRFRVLRNETNLGFPAGCNQAVAEAQGEHLLFLNNDTVVTEGWLEGLSRWFTHGEGDIGLVGAVTNYAPPPQFVQPDYPNLNGLAAFASRRRREFAKQALVTDRLTGFCLLVRREVLSRIGMFDERYGLGFFDDDDLCVRAREAGFRLVVALDTYIHHFGSQTFRALGVDCRQQLRENFARFQEKWGPERTAGYRMPGDESDPDPRPPSFGEALSIGDSQPPATANPFTISPKASDPARKMRVSLSMIVKNEEDHLPACLESVADLVDEVVIVDTGSTDRTKEVAAHFGARVFDFPWVDSFAAARNESLRHTTGDWVLWMDADDRLDGENRERLRHLLAGLKGENAAYAMKCLCLPDREGGTATVVDHVRLFRRHPALRWEYRVHEQILTSIRRLGGEVRHCDVVIQHTGYQDRALRTRKLERDLRLLRLEDEDRPDDPFTLFNIGAVLNELGRPAEAIPLLSRSLERSHPEDSIVRKLYALIVGCHRQMNQLEDALRVCQEGQRYCPGDTELLFLESGLHAEMRDFPSALASLRRLLDTPPGEYFASVDPALRGHKARHLLAVVYAELGQAAEAEAEWRKILAEQPSFLPGWLALSQLYVRLGRWADLEGIAANLESASRGALEAQVLRAQVHMGQQEFGAARDRLRSLIAQHPQAIWPREVLADVFLKEGLDWDGAARALRDVLALDPDNKQARHNLAVLRERLAGG